MFYSITQKPVGSPQTFFTAKIISVIKKKSESQELCHPAIEEVVKNSPVEKELVSISFEPGGFSRSLFSQFGIRPVDGKPRLQAVMEK